MPYPNNFRQNYRMRPNSTPPPRKNPYLSQQDLKKVAQGYNPAQVTAQNDASANPNRRSFPNNILWNDDSMDSRNIPPYRTDTTNSGNQSTMNMDNVNMTPTTDNITPTMDMNRDMFPRSNGRVMPDMNSTTSSMMDSNDWASPETRSWMNSMGRSDSTSETATDSPETTNSGRNPYNDNRVFPWMNPRDDDRLSPSTARDIRNRPAWMNGMEENVPDTITTNRDMDMDRSIDMNRDMIMNRDMDMNGNMDMNRNMNMNGNMDMNRNMNTNRDMDMNTDMDIADIISRSNQMNDGSLNFFPQDTAESREYERIIRSHPQNVRRIYTEVNRAFNNLDFSGSWIYDEHPDRTTLLRLSEDIYRSVLPITEGYDPSTDRPEEVEEQNLTPGLLPNRTSPRWMFYVVFILVQHELMHRRNLNMN